MKTAIVTGANRGLGLEFAKELLKRGYKVFATARNIDSFPLKNENLETIKLDLVDENSIFKTAKEISTRIDSLDLLINNAGIYDSSRGLQPVTSGKALRMYQINAVGPLQFTHQLMPLLQKGDGKTVAISSDSGRISRKDDAQNYIYAMSKAALNMGFHSLANEEPTGKNLKILIVDPGWMHTDMGGLGAPINPADSARKILDIVEKSDFESGAFLDTNGNIVPW